MLETCALFPRRPRLPMNVRTPGGYPPRSYDLVNFGGTGAEHRGFLATALFTLLLALPPAESLAQTPVPRVKNVIVMISDGAGYNTLEATRLWTGKPLAVDDAKRFRAASLSVHPLSTRNDAVPGPPGNDQDPAKAYDSASAWNPAPANGHGECPANFRGDAAWPYRIGAAGYSWHCATYPDSANTMTAMMSGVKSYNNAINVDGRGTPVVAAAEVAVAAGREAGVVTTADVTDATPAAGGGAHAINRSLRGAIGQEMFGRQLLSVIGGAGNPDFFNEGTRRDQPAHDFIDKATWEALKAAKRDGDRPLWLLVEDADRIRALGSGAEAPPATDLLALIGKGAQGLQQYRCASGDKPTGKHGCEIRPSLALPFETPLLTSQPMLTDLTGAALRLLNRGDGGFFLVIEESNTDRAAHANNLGRVIEARIAFEDSVRQVIAWIDSPASKASWDDTLLIVTADHDHLLFGPDADRKPFQPVQRAKKKGDLPRHQWFSFSHSNQLVPLYATGQGADAFMALATQTDPACKPRKTKDDPLCHPRYLDQADMGRFLIQALTR